jgi:hypothetical protein
MCWASQMCRCRGNICMGVCQTCMPLVIVLEPDSMHHMLCACRPAKFLADVRGKLELLLSLLAQVRGLLQCSSKHLHARLLCPD